MDPLRVVKLVHTVVWAGFVACIVAIPVCAAQGAFAAAAACAAVVAVEVAVLAANGRRCPLTAVAARYTADRRANFDIWLPEWLARHNQVVFGGLYLAGLVFLAVQWARAG